MNRWENSITGYPLTVGVARTTALLMGTFLLFGIVGETDSISPDMEPLMVSAVDLVDG
jgi:hypothetical protein